jgi:hypothetical protein
MIARETLLFESCVRRFSGEFSVRISILVLLVFRDDAQSLDSSSAKIYEPVPGEPVRIMCCGLLHKVPEKEQIQNSRNIFKITFFIKPA